MQKVSTLVGIIVIVVATVVFFGGVFTYQYFLSQNETAGWQTYTNDEYGFEIKYPKTEDSGINEGQKIGSYYNVMVVNTLVLDNNKGSFVNIDIDNSEEILKRCFKFEPYASLETSQDMKYKRQINGVDFFTNSQGSTEQVQFSAIYGNRCYIITGVIKSGDNQQKDIINNIISTFKFTK